MATLEQRELREPCYCWNTKQPHKEPIQWPAATNFSVWARPIEGAWELTCPFVALCEIYAYDEIARFQPNFSQLFLNLQHKYQLIGLVSRL